jgi:hypothetical protein
MPRLPRPGRSLFRNRLMVAVVASLLSWGLAAALLAGLYQVTKKLTARVQESPPEEASETLGEIAPAAGPQQQNEETP